ncbi:hypothetical protein ACTFIZ_012917 [Dictyostelium cf. discoideum]
MFVQPQKDNGTTCQTRFQVKSRKECSRTNSINYISRITNRFAINETSCSQTIEEKCYQRNKKLIKARLLESIVPHSARGQVRDFSLVNSSKPMEWKRNKSISKLRLYSHNQCSESGAGATLETMPQEESQLDWRAYSRILQCKNLPPKPSFRDESQIIQSNQELQLATEEGSIQSHTTSIRSNTDGSIRISPEPSNHQLLYNQNECTPPRLESMETMSEDELIQFEEGFHNTDISKLEISNMVSDDSSTSSSSSTSHVSSSSGYIPRSIDQTISRVNTNSNSTTLETRDYTTF